MGLYNVLLEFVSPYYFMDHTFQVQYYERGQYFLTYMTIKGKQRKL